MLDIVELVIILIVAGICGGIAQAMLGQRRRNFLLSIIIGVIGAYVGTLLVRQFGWSNILPLTIGDSSIDLGWAFVGSLLLVFLLSMVTRPRRR